MSCAHPINIKTGSVPCGQCILCKKQKSWYWAIRISHEAQTVGFDKCAFITLTYADNHLPLSSLGIPTLQKSDVQNFVKRLRNDNLKIRYFCSGEYGDQFGRPHYHLVLFGEAFTSTKDLDYLTDVWGMGIVHVGNVQWESIEYVAKYVIKKMTGQGAQVYAIDQISPEFAIMSRRPGIGYQYYLDHIKDIHPSDPKILHHGRKIVMPPYYRAKYWAQSAEHEAYHQAHYEAYLISQSQKMADRLATHGQDAYNLYRDQLIQAEANASKHHELIAKKRK